MSENITPEEVKRVTKLARIEITSKEEANLTEELSGVLKYIDTLHKVDTDGVEPTYHPAAPKNYDIIDNVTRGDRVIQCKDREKLLDSAPEREGDFVKVKSVFK